eukprot:6771653-Prymnesium_polylepis.1
MRGASGAGVQAAHASQEAEAHQLGVDTCDSCEVGVPRKASSELASFAGVSDDADEHAQGQLRLLQ